MRFKAIVYCTTQQIELMKKKLAAARRRIENGDGAKEGEEEEEVKLETKTTRCIVSTT